MSLQVFYISRNLNSKHRRLKNNNAYFSEHGKECVIKTELNIFIYIFGKQKSHNLVLFCHSSVRLGAHFTAQFCLPCLAVSWYYHRIEPNRLKNTETMCIVRLDTDNQEKDMLLHFGFSLLCKREFNFYDWNVESYEYVFIYVITDQ